MRNGMGGVGSDRQLNSGQWDAAGNIHNLCVWNSLPATVI